MVYKLTVAADAEFTEPLRVWGDVDRQNPEAPISLSLVNPCVEHLRYSAAEQRDIPVTEAYLTALQYGKITAYDLAGNATSSETFFFGEAEVEPSEEESVPEESKKKRRWRR